MDQSNPSSGSDSEKPLNEIKVKITSGDDALSRTLYYKTWDPVEQKRRALRKTLKIVGSIFAVSSIGLFVHILLIVVIPILIGTVLVAVPIYIKFANEGATFIKVNGPCPKCGNQNPLRPYLDSQLREEMTLQCAACGETIKAHT